MLLSGARSVVRDVVDSEDDAISTAANWLADRLDDTAWAQCRPILAKIHSNPSPPTMDVRVS